MQISVLMNKSQDEEPAFGWTSMLLGVNKMNLSSCWMLDNCLNERGLDANDCGLKSRWCRVLLGLMIHQVRDNDSRPVIRQSNCMHIM